MFVEHVLAGRALALAHEFVDVARNNLGGLVAALLEATSKGIVLGVFEIFSHIRG